MNKYGILLIGYLIGMALILLDLILVGYIIFNPDISSYNNVVENVGISFALLMLCIIISRRLYRKYKETNQLETTQPT